MYPRRHAGLADPRRRASRRPSGPRRRRTCDGDVVRNVPVLAEALRRRRLSRAAISNRRQESYEAGQRGDREAFRHRERLRAPAEAVGRGAHLRVVWKVQKTRKRLGVLEPKGPRLPTPRLHQANDEEAMQSSMNSSDRLSEVP